MRWASCCRDIIFTFLNASFTLRMSIQIGNMCWTVMKEMGLFPTFNASCLDKKCQCLVKQRVFICTAVAPLKQVFASNNKKVHIVPFARFIWWRNVAARALETACWWKIGEIEESSAQQFQDRARSHGKTRRGPRTEARWWVRSGTEYYSVPGYGIGVSYIYIYIYYKPKRAVACGRKVQKVSLYVKVSIQRMSIDH